MMIQDGKNKRAKYKLGHLSQKKWGMKKSAQVGLINMECVRNFMEYLKIFNFFQKKL